MAKYQLNYASSRPQMYDKKSRIVRAERMVKLLGDYFGENEPKKLTALDVGSSTGIIDAYLAGKFKKVVGIDIDEKGVKFAQKHYKKNNLVFRVGDAMNLGFKNNSFDVVICAQVYEHVPDSRKLFNEIYRVLNPGGICYLAAINKFWPWEPHYNLPFLSYLPKSMADSYVRFFGKAKNYWENPVSWWQLIKLTRKFKIIDYTEKILSNPTKYGYENIPVPKLISRFLKYFTPTFFWLLVKPEGKN